MAAGKKFSISVLIGGKSTLGKTFAAVGKQTKAFADKLHKVGSALFKGLKWAGAVAGAAVALGVKLLGDYLERAGELKDFAAQVGWSTEALQEWGYAAGQAGVKGGEFNAALVKMGKSVQDAKGKTGALYKLLSKGGKHDREFLKRLQGASSPEEQLDLLVSAMEAIPDPQKRAQLAMAAFGKSGARMARLAAEGSAGLERLRQEARDLGIVMSGEDVDAAEALGDKLDKLKAGIMGVGNEIFRQLVPSLDGATTGMTDWIKKNRKWLGQKIADVIKRIGRWLSEVDWVGVGEAISSAFSTLGKVLRWVWDHKGALLAVAGAFAAIKVGSLVTSVVGLGAKFAGGIASAFGPGGLIAVAALGLAAMIGKGISDILSDQGRRTHNREAKEKALEEADAKVEAGQSEILGSGAAKVPARDVIDMLLDPLGLTGTGRFMGPDFGGGIPKGLGLIAEGAEERQIIQSGTAVDWQRMLDRRDDARRRADTDAMIAALRAQPPIRADISVTVPPGHEVETQVTGAGKTTKRERHGGPTGRRQVGVPQ